MNENMKNKVLKHSEILTEYITTQQLISILTLKPASWELKNTVEELLAKRIISTK